MNYSPVIDGTLLLDPWFKQYIDELRIEEKQAIAWTDYEAVTRYPEYAWVYDKYMLNCQLDQDVWLDVNLGYDDEIPKNIFVKPRVNLKGMGTGAYTSTRAEEAEEDNKGDFIIQPIYKGTHYSVDIIVNNGQIVDMFGFIAHKNDRGSFTYFESVEKSNLPKCLNKAVSLLNKYVGVINIECIGENVIEMHLRPSMDFYDISGGIIKQAINFVRYGLIIEPISFEQTYCVVFRLRRDCRPFTKASFIKATERPPTPIKSVQFCWEADGDWLGYFDQDGCSYVLMRVNGTDKKACLAHGNRIYKHLKLKR